MISTFWLGDERIQLLSSTILTIKPEWTTYYFGRSGLIQDLVVHGVGHQQVRVQLRYCAVTLSLDLQKSLEN
jgi:hypothetical protein